MSFHASRSSYTNTESKSDFAKSDFYGGSDPVFLSLARERADGTVSVHQLTKALKNAGLRVRDDPLLKEFNEELAKLDDPETLNYEQWTQVTSKNSTLIQKALTGQLVVPDWEEFTKDIVEIFDSVKNNEEGHVADYIPQLGCVDPKYFGVSVCTVDGQVFSHGDAAVDFCIQSCSKTITYLLAVKEHGLEKVHNHVGREPSGQIFNKLTLKDVEADDDEERAVPHNPMINAGAIMSCSLIKADEKMGDRFSHVHKAFTELCGDTKVGFQNATYLSEKQSADRNTCLGYMMREMKSFPADTDVPSTLEFYFQVCSLEMNANQMGVLAASLANGGICPTTNKEIFNSNDVKNCLCLMLSCGLYDYSGEWAFRVGLPAKSGVGGSIFIVIPNKMGICIWSPRLDKMGNSVRGVEFAKRLVETFNFHHMDNLRGILANQKKDPCKAVHERHDDMVTHLLFAASRGDLKAMKRLVADGIDLFAPDYDERTALHLASAEGHLSVVKYIIQDENNKFISVENVNHEDRWGGTALDDATRHNHTKIIELLKQAGAGHGSGVAHCSRPSSPK